MTTAYTSLLGLALPVTGELSGTWGDTVNNSITSLLDTSVAGTTNVSTDTDVTLTTTTGAANTARQAILLFSGARTALRTVTAPAQSKIYTVINATTGGFSVKLVGAGPTTGVTIVAGESAVCAWNGSDFVKVSNTGGSASFVNLTASGTVTFTGLSASQAVFTNASDELVSNAITGTGNVVMSASPTLTGTISAAALTASGNVTLSGGTANGVAYLNGSKVVTSGSALTFNGDKLAVSGAGIAGADDRIFTVTNTAANSYGAMTLVGTSRGGYLNFYNGSTAQAAIVGQASALSFYVGTDSSGSQSMILNSTGLGIGTSSPATKIDARLSGTSSGAVINVGNTGSGIFGGFGVSDGGAYPVELWGSALSFKTGSSTYASATEKMRLDSSGNLGVGTTSPTNKVDILTADNTGLTVRSTNYSGSFGPSGLGGMALTTAGAYPLIFYINGAERARIDSSGNFMVGTTTIGAGNRMNVVGNNVVFSPNTAGKDTHTFSTGAADVGTYTIKSDTTVKVSLNAGGTSYFTGGSVAIGATSASGVLDVTGRTYMRASGSDSVLTFVNQSGGDGSISATGTASTMNYGFSTYSTGNALYIANAGNVGVGTSGPNAKLTVWTPSTTGLQTALRLNNPFGFDNVNTGAQIVFSQDRSTAEDFQQGIIAVGQESPGSSVNAYMAFSTNSTGVSEKMRISAAGLVGIGTNGPGQRLDVNGSIRSRDGAFIASIGTTTKGLFCTYNQIFGSGSDYTPVIFAETGLGMTFAVNGTSTKAMTLDSSGNLLVGTTSGSNRLTVSSAANDYVSRLYNTNATGSDMLYMQSTADPNDTTYKTIYTLSNASARFYVQSNGGIGNYQANNVNLSDRREKTNFAPAGSYLDKICAIPVQTFNYIDQNFEADDGLTLGVVAQDVQAVAPELVMETNWGTEEAPKMRLSIYQTDLQYALMKCIQEQQAIIESLKARLDAANL
jgi:hypothetical protein